MDYIIIKRCKISTFSPITVIFKPLNFKKTLKNFHIYIILNNFEV